jgi:hypothetical protein
MGIGHSNLGSFSLCTCHLKWKQQTQLHFMKTTQMETTKASNIMTTTEMETTNIATTEMETTNTANMMTTTKKTSMQFPHTFYNKHIACTFKIFKQAYFTQLPLNESY